MFLAPSMMAEGDKDRDGKLTGKEFQGLAEQWFAAWDNEKAGRLNVDQLAAGLGTIAGPRPGGSPPPDAARSPLLADVLLVEAVRKGWLTPALGAAGPLPPRKPLVPLATILDELASDREDR